MNYIKSVIHKFYLSETRDSIGIFVPIICPCQRKVVPLYQRGQPLTINRQPDRKASLCETE